MNAGDLYWRTEQLCAARFPNYIGRLGLAGRQHGANAIILQVCSRFMVGASATTPVPRAMAPIPAVYGLTADCEDLFRISKERKADTAFRVPLYPVVPIAFAWRASGCYGRASTKCDSRCIGVPVLRDWYHGARNPAYSCQEKRLSPSALHCRVAREKHFGRAAETASCSQPTRRWAVKKLEEELGVTLFERGPGEGA